MLHIAHLTLSASTAGGGISEAVRALTSAQEAACLRTAVLSAKDGGTPIPNWPAGSPHWLGTKKLPGIQYLPDLADHLDQISPDLCHVHGLWSWLSIGTRRWSAANSKPYVVSPHGMLDAWALANSRWKKYLAGALYERQNLRGAACLHALCQSEAESIRAYGLGNPIAVIPNGINLPQELAATLAPSNNPKILLFLGRLHPKKGLINALKAWKDVSHSASTGSEWKFVIAGWDQGGHEAELKQLCDELGLTWTDTPAASFLSENGKLHTENSIIFTGPAFGETKDALLRQANAFILPSFSEGLPMSVLEAWAYRLPVVMTDFCNLPEGFAAGAAVRIGTDVESIAQGMRVITGSSATDLQSLASNGRSLVEQRFTWPRIAAQMEACYTWILGGGERPDSIR